MIHQTRERDPRDEHPHDQIIRRVYTTAALPAAVIASYDPVTNILIVAADYFDNGIQSIRNKMLACTGLMYEYEAY